jgi:hypothetical protein
MECGRSAGLLLGAMLAAVLASGTEGPSVAEELLAQSTSIPVASGATVELLVVKGEASFLPSKDDKVLVEYAKAVPAEVNVVAVTTAAGITICGRSSFPSPSPAVGQSSRCTRLRKGIRSPTLFNVSHSVRPSCIVRKRPEGQRLKTTRSPLSGAQCVLYVCPPPRSKRR